MPNIGNKIRHSAAPPVARILTPAPNSFRSPQDPCKEGEEDPIKADKICTLRRPHNEPTSEPPNRTLLFERRTINISWSILKGDRCCPSVSQSVSLSQSLYPARDRPFGGSYCMYSNRIVYMSCQCCTMASP